MGRRMKNGKYVNVNIDVAAFEALERHCRESGQTKTVAVERAVLACYGPKPENDLAQFRARPRIRSNHA